MGATEENEIIVTITASKAALSKTIKVALCLEADLSDWLEHAQHASVTWCFVIYFTVTVRDGHFRKQHSHHMSVSSESNYVSRICIHTCSDEMYLVQV